MGRFPSNHQHYWILVPRQIYKTRFYNKPSFGPTSGLMAEFELKIQAAKWQYAICCTQFLTSQFLPSQLATMLAAQQLYLTDQHQSLTAYTKSVFYYYCLILVAPEGLYLICLCVSYGNPVTYIVSCRGALQLGVSLLGIPPRV